MGPRSIDRGNGAKGGLPGRHRSASMGPRSIDRGNWRRPRTSISAPSLQWGRDRLIAEMTPAYPHFPDRCRLQWGRDRLIAEMRLKQAAKKRAGRLQWGRDRLIAE